MIKFHQGFWQVPLRIFDAVIIDWQGALFRVLPEDPTVCRWIHHPANTDIDPVFYGGVDELYET